MRFPIPVLAVFLSLVSCDSKKPAPETVAAPTPAPAPKLVIEGTLDFGAIDAGDKTSKTLVLKNPGNAHLHVTGVSYPGGFAGEEDPFSIDPGAAREIEVVFAPEKAGEFTGMISVSTAEESREIPASGSAREKTGVLELSGDLKFEEVSVGETSAGTLVLKNTGIAPLHVAGITLPEGFRGTFSGSIEPGAERKTRLVFTPAEAKKYSGPLSIELTSGTGQTSLELAANATPPPPAPPGLITVPAGTLPESSPLAGESVTTFHIAPYETTWGEWNAVREFGTLNGYDLPDSTAAVDPNRPVRGIKWTDALKWCNAKSQRDGLPPVYFVDGEVFRSGDSAPQLEPNSDGYRLPTEAEWEWAARGALSEKEETYSGSNDLNEVAWNWDNATAAGEDLLDGRGTAAVGLKKPNALGLHDMSGNVAEWCWNESENGARRIRGGAWFGSPADCAVSARASNPTAGADFIGFRVARNRAATPVQASEKKSPLAFTTKSNLPEAIVGTLYSAPVELEGGTEPLEISLQPGDSLPAGLSLRNNQITGTPASAGSATFTLDATDSSNPVSQTTQRKFTLRTAPYGLSISPEPASIQASYNKPASISFQAQGGEAPYRWTAESPVPSGLALNPQTGELTGTPATAGPFSLALRVRDAKGFSATRVVPVSIGVDPIQLSADPATAPEATAGLPFSWSVQINGGVPPYSANASPSTPLPEGLSISTRGNVAALSGKPAPAGDYSVTLEAKDSSGRQAALDLKFSIKPYDLAIAPDLAKSLKGKYREPIDLPFTATGGKPPYVWTLEGKLPSGVYLSRLGGLKGNPAAEGEFPITVKVTDANRLSASVDAVLEITVDPLQLSADPAEATAGLPLNWPLKIQGGIPPYTVQLAEGSKLPEGLTLATSGISGKPDAAGDSKFTLEALDSSGLKTSLDLALVIKPYDLAVKTLMSKGAFGSPLEVLLTAAGGKEPYAWSIEGKLPSGLSLSRSGKITGTPASAGDFPLVLKVTDANRLSATSNVTLTITVDPLQISADPAEATAGLAFNQPFKIQGGVPPYTIQLAEGSTLPEGLVIAPSGLTGKPAAAGDFQFTVEALDSSGLKNSLDFSLAVKPYDLAINSPLLTGNVSERLEIPLVATGGREPYTWSIEGNLPSGLSLSRSAKVQGSPSESGNFPVVLKVTDANKISVTANTTVTISDPAPPPTPTPTPTPSPTPTPAPKPAPTVQGNEIEVEGGTLPLTSTLAGKTVGNFSIARTEVTWGDWKKIRSRAAELGYDIAEAGEGTGDKHPVRNVSWFDAVKWCNLRSEIEGLDPVYVAEGTVFRSGEKTPELSPGANGYRLPTEIEWEWAARGGKSSLGHTYSGSDDPTAVALHSANNPASGTKPAASLAANELGLHDMSGNVREWVWDSYKNYRRFRGGGFNDETFGVTVSGSDFNYPNRRTPDTGFRTVRGAAQ